MPGPAHHISKFSKKEVTRLIRTGFRRVHSLGLNILVAPQVGTSGRILVVTPRRIGSAPSRNKIRRRLKAIFYEEKLNRRGLDCIVFVKKQALVLSFDQLKQLLFKAFNHDS